VRVVALLGPIAKQQHVRRFEQSGVNIVSGNEPDPTDQPDAALVFGGDGTMHRHLGVLSRKQIPTLIVPMGSANDFAHSIGITTVEAAFAAWQRFCSAGDNVRTVDLGTIQRLAESANPGRAAEKHITRLAPSTHDDKVQARADNEAAPLADNSGASETPSPWSGESLEALHFVPSGPRKDLPQLGPRIMQSQLRHMIEAVQANNRTTYFACIAGTGLDAAVNRLTLNQPRWLRGHGGYVVALVQVLAAFRPPAITLSVEIDGQWQTRVQKEGFLVALGNGPQYGSGMRLTHQAQLNDGLLDVCFVRSLSKLRLLRLFRVVYHGGHIGMKEVDYFRVTRARLFSDPVSEVFADGEYICRTPVEIGIKRDALRLILNQ
jgi:diacylglycerol kinase family enzyme